MVAFLRRQYLNLPVAPLAGGVIGFVMAALFALMPTEMLEDLVVGSGIASVVAAAEPPLGLTARFVLIFLAGGGIGLIAWFALFLLLGSRSIVIQPGVGGDDQMPKLRRADAHPDAPARRPLSAVRDLGTPFLDVRAGRPLHMGVDETDDAVVEISPTREDARIESELHEADIVADDSAEAHVFAPVIEPEIVEGETIEAEFHEVEIAEADEPYVVDADAEPREGEQVEPESAIVPPQPTDTAQPVEHRPATGEMPLPADLDQPLAAFDPTAIPEDPADWFPAPAPLRMTQRRPVFDPTERFDTFDLAPQPPRPASPTPSAFTPSVPPAPRPDPSVTIHALLDRLERGVARRDAVAPVVPAPPPQTPAPEPAPVRRHETLEEALETLRRLATRR